MQLVSFYILWKHQKTSDFVMCARGIGIGHWCEIILCVLFSLRENCPYSEVFFSHLGWIRSDTDYLSTLSPTAEKYRPKNSEYGQYAVIKKMDKQKSNFFPKTNKCSIQQKEQVFTRQVRWMEIKSLYLL